MAYVKQLWADGADGNTPISAARLAYMEDGIAAAATGNDLLGTYARFVNVSTGSEARPSGGGLVIWVGGAVQPTNMAVGDLWMTSTGAPGGGGTVDTTAPTVPTDLVASNVLATSFSLSWTPSTDAVGVTQYDVQRGGVSVGNPTAPPMTITGLTANTTYSMRVRARDAAGNYSALSTALSVTTSAAATDVTPPTVPTGVAVSSITSGGFTVTWNASTDAVGVTGYEVQANGVAVASSLSTSAAVSGRAANTTYSVQVRARDAAGNWSALSTAVSVTTQPSLGSSVFGGGNLPTPIKQYNEGAAVEVGNIFYMAPAGTTRQLVGARIYTVATNQPVASTATINVRGLWPVVNGTNEIPTDNACWNKQILATKTMTGITAGAWTDVLFDTPVSIPAGNYFMVTYKFGDSSYYVAPKTGSSLDHFSSADGIVWMTDQGEVIARGRYKYDNGNMGGSDAFWGIDVLVTV